MLAQTSAFLLRDRLHLFSYFITRQNAEALHEPEGETTGKAGDFIVFLKLDQRLEQSSYVALDPTFETKLNSFAIGAVQLIASDQRYARLQDRSPGFQSSDGRGLPNDMAVFRQRQVGVGSGGDCLGAGLNFLGNRLERCRLESALKGHA